MTFNLQDRFLTPMECTSLSSKQITADDPTDGQTLVYDAATDRFDYESPLIVTANQTVAGTLTIQDWVALGTNGTRINNMQALTVTVPSPIAPNGFGTVVATFTGFATVPPIVIAQAREDPATHDYVVSVRRTALANTVDVIVYNSSAAPSTAPTTVYLLALEAAAP